MVQLTIETGGAKELSVQLGISAERLKDFAVPLEASAQEIIKSFDLDFDVRGAMFVDGGWAPRTKDYPWPLLEKTGAMRRGFVSSVDGITAVIGNSDWKFPFHQLGTRKMPQRLMMKLDDIRKEFVVKTFQLYIVESLRTS